MIKAVKLEASAELATTTSSADKMEAVATSANNNSNGDTTVVPPSAVDADVLESLDDGLHFNPAELDEKAVLGEDDESTAIADQQEMAATVKKELNGAASGNGNGLADTTIDSTGVGDETDDLYDAALETSGAIEVKRESAEIQSSLPSGHQLLGGGGGQTGSSSGSLTGRRYCCYIGNMTWWTTDEDLQKAVESCGVFDVVDLKFYENRSTGQCKGFALGVFASEPSVKKLMENLPLQKIHDQTLCVLPYTKQSLARLEETSKRNDPRSAEKAAKLMEGGNIPSSTNVFGSSGGGRSSYNANSNNYNNSNNEVGGGGGGGGGEMAGTKAGMPYIGTIRIGTAGTTSQMQPIGLNQITALPPRPLFGGGGGGGPPPPHSSSSTGPTGVGGGQQPPTGGGMMHHHPPFQFGGHGSAGQQQPHGMIRGPSAGPPGLGGGLLGAPPGAVASVGMGMSLGGLFGGQQPPLQSLFQQRPPASVNLSASTLAGAALAQQLAGLAGAGGGGLHAHHQQQQQMNQMGGGGSVGMNRPPPAFGGAGGPPQGLMGGGGGMMMGGAGVGGGLPPPTAGGLHGGVGQQAMAAHHQAQQQGMMGGGGKPGGGAMGMGGGGGLPQNLPPVMPGAHINPQMYPGFAQQHGYGHGGGGHHHGGGVGRGGGGHDNGALLTDVEFEEIMTRNRTVSSSALTRAVNDSSAGDYNSAIETLVTAISLIRQSRISHDDRCKVLVASLQDTLNVIESKAYSSHKASRSRRDRSRSPDERGRKRHRRSRSPRSRSPRGGGGGGGGGYGGPMYGGGGPGGGGDYGGGGGQRYGSPGMRRGGRY